MKAMIRVFGRVQGVFFRQFVRETAKRLGVNAVAENLEDGSVEIRAEGERKHLEQLIAACQKGPPLANVTRLEVEWE
jgi:acylphosphatase